MPAVPYRAELRTKALRGVAGFGLIAVAAVASTSLRALGLGLIIGGLGLLIDIELDVLAIVLAIGVGGVAGADLLNALTLGRYERAHHGTVFRVEDPPGTEAGLGWLSEGG